MAETQDSTQIDENFEHVEFRDGNLFVIDVSPEMFERSADGALTYFEQCLHSYGRILSQKLMWNKRDWMGLMFYNSTKKRNDDPEPEQIITVQKLAEVESKMLRELMDIVANKATKEYYCDPSSAIKSDSCLHDVLWQACRSFDSIKIAMPLRQAVLLTRRDNPLPSDEAERHKIRLRAKTYRDINVKLRIIGLGDDWNEDLFYKDIDVLANDIRVNEAKRMKLMDLEIQVRFPARTSGHLKWRIGKDMEISTFVTSFSSKTKYLKKARMHKDTNEILEEYKHWGPPRMFDDWEDEGDQDVVETRISDKLFKVIKCGDRLVSFRPNEVKEMRTSQNGINLIGFKPIALDFIYHIKGTKFVGVENSASKEEKELFAALLGKCDAKKVMAICAVTHRAGPYLAKMIPCSKFNGFYLYKIAFSEQINGLEEYIKSYVHGPEKPMPIDEEGVSLMRKILGKTRIKWVPYRFSNPKLVRQLAYIETLALDLEASAPQDDTRPNTTFIVSRIANLARAFEDMFDCPSVPANKRGGTAARVTKPGGEKLAKFDDKLIRDLIESGKLKEIKLTSLQSFARSLGLPTSGTKNGLVERITAYYVKKNDGN